VASGVEGTCFKISVAKPAKAKAAVTAINFENAVGLGEGMCRGSHWQDGVNWPKDKGRRSLKECHTGCKQTTGANAIKLFTAISFVLFIIA
jgi:hypothetical protein